MDYEKPSAALVLIYNTTVFTYVKKILSKNRKVNPFKMSLSEIAFNMLIKMTSLHEQKPPKSK